MKTWKLHDDCATKDFSTIPWCNGENGSSTTLSVSNPQVAIHQEDLQVFPDFVTAEETSEILKEVYMTKEDFVWQGFDQRRKVQRWHGHQSLPPTLSRIAERVRHQLSKIRDDNPAAALKEAFQSISVEELPKSQTLRHLNLNKSQVTTFETPNVCTKCCQPVKNETRPSSDSTDCNCFVAILPLTASLIEHINRPKERSVNCWDLSLPAEDHSAFWVLPHSSLIVKRKGFLFEWRRRIAKILVDMDVNGEATSQAIARNSEDDTVVLLKFCHLPIEVVETTTRVPSPEFGYVLTPEIRAEELRRRAMPMPPMEELLTILVTTSPIKSNPSTELLEQVFDTFRLGGYDFAFKCRKIIICDGARQRDDSTTQKYSNTKQAMRHGLVTSEQNENYAVFKQNLRRLCEKASKNDQDTPSPFCNTTVHELESRHGYGFALRHALRECITTPYVMVIQHDRTLMRPTPINETLNAMWNHSNIKYVGMSMRSNLMYRDQFSAQYGRSYMDEMSECILRPPELLLNSEQYGPDSHSTKQMNYGGYKKLRENILSLIETYRKCQQYTDYVAWLKAKQLSEDTLPPGKHQLTLTPTFFWYDNVHICETKHYRDFIFDPRYKMVVKGGFVEDKLSPVIKKTVERLGLTEGHSRFGCFLLDDHSGMFFTGHKDGGSFLDSATKERVLMERRSSNGGCAITEIGVNE